MEQAKELMKFQYDQIAKARGPGVALKAASEAKRLGLSAIENRLFTDIVTEAATLDEAVKLLNENIKAGITDLPGLKVQNIRTMINSAYKDTSMGALLEALINSNKAPE